MTPLLVEWKKRAHIVPLICYNGGIVDECFTAQNRGIFFVD